jgi:CRISPR-associated protein Cmr2
MPNIFLFQIGPVQAFIAQARRTQDLFIGSHLLSQLAAAGLEAASAYPGFEWIFPEITSDGVKGGAPHRFAFVCDGEPAEVAQTVKAAIDDRWLRGFANPVQQYVRRRASSTAWESIFERQVEPEAWMEFYWAAVPYIPSRHQQAFAEVNVALAQRKNVRFFPQIEEAGSKCTLTGSQSVVEENRSWWNGLRTRLGDNEGRIFRDNERLGGMALVKRLAAKAGCAPDFESFPSTNHIAADNLTAPEVPGIGKEVSGYLAVLHMDGDHMGETLSKKQSLSDHRAFTQKLAEYADGEAEAIIRTFGGAGGTARLVYSGGDDVLALLPLRSALQCAYELRKKFGEITGCQASAGIAITPSNLPLDRALELARQAEARAKHGYGRDAVVVIEAHGTGQMREAGAKWNIIDFLVRLQILFEQRVLSGKLGYDLLMLDEYLFDVHPGEKGWDGKPLSPSDLTAARRAEVRRLVKRRTAEGVTPDETLIQEMVALVEGHTVGVPTWTDMANWVILARFLAQEGAPQP